MRRTISSLSVISVVALASLSPAGQAHAASGGPDGFGYSFVDQADGAVYVYVNITATGTNLGNGDDTLIAAVNLGAPFTFYGNVVNQLRPSTNGFITSTAGTSSDFSNDCPLPLAPGGGGFRIAVLHDDLISTVYYQYFDQAAAAGVGYPGETAGISVFQWAGEYYPAGGGDAVNMEAILFHDDNTILTMVSQDTNGGAGATLGIQDATATNGLNYTCNVGGGTIPGVTAVEYSLAPPPPPTDSDCCTPSPTGAPGCLDAACEAAVCAADAFCCDTSWDDICAGEAGTACPGLCGACGDGVVGGSEECDTAGESAMCDADCTLVACGDSTVNATAGEDCDDGGETVTCDSDCTAVACGDGLVNTTAGETCDDGGRSPLCNADCTAVSCGDGVVNAAAGEECDDGGESATCDPDCTNAMCGDMVLNEMAGEECDEGAETKACDDDCTAAACGDGVTNEAAGEECDDGNTDDGDGCSATCTVEDEPGTTGEGSTGDEPTTGEPTTGEPGDSSGGGGSSGGVDDTAGSEGGPGPVSVTAGNGSTDDGGTDTDDPGALPPVEGCGCTTDGPGSGRGAVWSVLALFGLGALRRRRRRG